MRSAAFIFLIILTLFMPLPWGANSTWASMLIASGMLLLGLWTLWLPANEKPVQSVSLNYLFAIWLSWLAVIAFQLLPLPANWLEVLSPAALQLRCDVLSAEVCSGPQPLSLYPEETQRKLLFSIALMALFFSVTRLLTQRKQLITLMYVLLISGLFQAAYGVFMGLSGLNYGFFAVKPVGHGMATGTFVNQNHLAGYLEMCAGMGVGLLIYQFRAGEKLDNWRDRLSKALEGLLSAKVLVRLSLIVIVIGLIMTRSRMGNSAFFGAVVIGGFAWLVLTKRTTKMTMFIFLSLILVDVYLVGGWFGFERVAESIGSTDLKTELRVPVAQYTWDMAKDFPVLGSGLGSYASVFSAYKQGYTGALFAHAHNDYLEFFSEVGLIGCIPLALIWGYAFYCSIYAMRKRKSALHKSLGLGCFMAMTSIAIHSSVDFNLQIPANAATFVLILALSWVAAHGRLSGGKKIKRAQ